MHMAGCLVKESEALNETSRYSSFLHNGRPTVKRELGPRDDLAHKRFEIHLLPIVRVMSQISVES